jgi:hypothetical protein
MAVVMISPFGLHARRRIAEAPFATARDRLRAWWQGRKGSETR